MNNRQIAAVIRKIRCLASQWKTPVVAKIGLEGDPFRVLVSCILSLRTRDETTEAASRRLFDLADCPQAMRDLEPAQIEHAIYPVAFYRNKAKTLKMLCRELMDRGKGKVPDSLVELLKLKGVGRKTANLTLTLGHGKTGICVDTHVHRICNRWGYLATDSPEATEMALRDKLPEKYWMEFNGLLVAFGQNVCKPISPLCSQCPVSGACQKTGVGNHR